MRFVDRYHVRGVAALRIVVGIIFLWAGLEKAIGTGLGTWTAEGFLRFGTAGSLGWPFVTGEVAEGTAFNPTHDFWVGLAGTGTNSLIDWLVPLGQIGIGVGLTLGLLTRFSSAMGTLMMLTFFLAAWDFQFGVVNQHLTYAMVTAFLGYIGSGHFYGLDTRLEPSVPPWVARRLCSGGTEAQRQKLGLMDGRTSLS